MSRKTGREEEENEKRKKIAKLFGVRKFRCTFATQKFFYNYIIHKSVCI